MAREHACKAAAYENRSDRHGKLLPVRHVRGDAGERYKEDDE